jgi:lipoprotein signal peptidase
MTKSMSKPLAKSSAKKVYATKSGHAPWWAWLGLTLIILLADQFTKILVIGYYQLGDSTPVTSFFNLVRAHNTGAAFSFLANAGGWQRWFFTGIGVHCLSLGCCVNMPGKNCLPSPWHVFWVVLLAM